jgi:hypothetical protein
VSPAKKEDSTISILGFILIAFLLLLGGGALIRGVMSFWSDEPSYVHAYTMYIIAVLVSFQTRQFAFQDWGVLVFLVPTYLIYSLGLNLPKECGFANWRRWLRGAILAAVHVTITIPVLFMLVI